MDPQQQIISPAPEIQRIIPQRPPRTPLEALEISYQLEELSPLDALEMLRAYNDRPLPEPVEA